MIRRRLATVAALAATTAASLAVAGPVAADPIRYGPLPWTASTTGTNGAFTVHATCSFGPIVWPGRPESFDYAGVAVAPGAVATTVTCSVPGGTRTTAGSASAVAGHVLWEVDAFCVSASAVLPTGAVVTAPKACVTP